MNNYIEVKFKSIIENVSLARMIISGFVVELDPTLDQLSDIKTSISEAVTNAIIHGYNNDDTKQVSLKAVIEDNILTIIIKDSGEGIDNIEKARQPLFTSKPELERSGLGFTIMETFMDSLIVTSLKNSGTTITMTKKIDNKDSCNDED